MIISFLLVNQMILVVKKKEIKASTLLIEFLFIIDLKYCKKSQPFFNYREVER